MKYSKKTKKSIRKPGRGQRLKTNKKNKNK